MSTTLQPAVSSSDENVESSVAFKTWRIVDGDLCSRFMPLRWTGPVLQADCFFALPTPFRSSSPWLDEPHHAPHPQCGCGIHAEWTPDLHAPAVDFRAVTGIVALWGTACDAPGGFLRAEHARVCALGLLQHASRRQRGAIDSVAAQLECDVLDVRELDRAAARYGKTLPIATIGTLT
jgi:hypothetical protein